MKTIDLAAIESVLQTAASPLCASDIARELGVPRRDVNAVLHQHMDTVFFKNTSDFTWTRATQDKLRGASPPEVRIRVEAHFAPQDDPIHELCKLIDEAKSSIYVQAYYLRSEPIANAMIRAKRRRVQVRVLLGCTSTRSKATRDPAVRHGGTKHRTPKSLHAAGIEVSEDWGETHNHNKCMVIDECRTVTGGLNFCDYAADNADNMVVIHSTAVAEQFTRDWQRNFAIAEPFAEDPD